MRDRQPTADRLQNMKDRCAELGLTLVETTTPDPMSDAGAVSYTHLDVYKRQVI